MNSLKAVYEWFDKYLIFIPLGFMVGIMFLSLIFYHPSPSIEPEPFPLPLFILFYILFFNIPERR